MNILNIEHISKIYGEKVIFDDVSLGIHSGDKIGVIGVNGTGKTTLLKIIAKINEPDKGQIICGNGIRVSYLPQNPEFPKKQSILEYVMDGKEHPLSEIKAKLAERRYPSVAYEIAAALEEKTNREIRVTVPGHTQRGGAPCAYDRVLATRVGAYAAELILNKEYGYMVGIVDGDTQKVPLSEVAGKLKYVDPECQMIKDAKTIGISFGE